MIQNEAIARFWRELHNLLNARMMPEQTSAAVLARIGTDFGADRAYTFAVSTDRGYSSCTNEWTSHPEYAIKDHLQNVDQTRLAGWLNRFDIAKHIRIEDTENPPPDLKIPAAKFRHDLIKSIYVFSFIDNGRLVGYLGIDYIERKVVLNDRLTDILYQVASTLNLYLLRHESLELWNSLATALPSALFIKDVDDDLKYCFANPRYRQIYGATVVGRNDYELFGPDNGRKFRQEDAECIKSGQTFRSNGPQTDYSSKAQGYYTIEKFPVTTHNGHHYVAGFITDITAEHELLIKSQELLEKAKAAERAKSMFLASTSHEIRTPLNAIIGFLDELRHEDIPEKTRDEYIASAATASRALLALINDVLDMSKIEAGRMHMTPVETDLLLLLGECATIFSESCNGKGITYKCDVSENMPILMVDMTRLRQILFNLIGNAVKFTREGGIYVYGGFSRETDRTGQLVIEVSDTGIGISPEDQKTVFKLFEQASGIRGTHVANKGTGLGLCLCNRLAECMNGEIRLESELGKGSTFRVILHDLPYVERTQASDVVRHRKDRTIRMNPITFRARVLIVDDVPMNLKVLGIILKRMSIDFTPASSAKKALEILANDPDITHVLTDIWMPDMNGEDLAKTIRADERRAKIRIAAQTADVEASNNFDASLFDAILSKPITPEKVLAFLRG